MNQLTYLGGPLRGSEIMVGWWFYPIPKMSKGLKFPSSNSKFQSSLGKHENLTVDYRPNTPAAFLLMRWFVLWLIEFPGEDLSTTQQPKFVRARPHTLLVFVYWKLEATHYKTFWKIYKKTFYPNFYPIYQGKMSNYLDHKLNFAQLLWVELDPLPWVQTEIKYATFTGNMMIMIHDVLNHGFLGCSPATSRVPKPFGLWLRMILWLMFPQKIDFDYTWDLG